MELRGEEDFGESYHWTELAKEKKIRLPLWRHPCNSSGMRRFLKKLDYSVEQYLDDNAEKNLRVFGNLNPDWPLRAWVGLLLENIDYNEKHEAERIASSEQTVSTRVPVQKTQRKKKTEMPS